MFVKDPTESPAVAGIMVITAHRYTLHKTTKRLIELLKTNDHIWSCNEVNQLSSLFFSMSLGTGAGTRGTPQRHSAEEKRRLYFSVPSLKWKWPDAQRELEFYSMTSIVHLALIPCNSLSTWQHLAAMADESQPRSGPSPVCVFDVTKRLSHNYAIIFF